MTSALQRCCASFLHQARRLYWRIFRPLTLGVAGIVLDDQNRVLLVKNSYRAGWHLPGGGVKRGETVIEAMQRELFEEVGLKTVQPPQEILGVYSNFSDRKYGHVVVFVIRDGKIVATYDKNFEIEEVRAFPLNALPANVGSGTQRRIQELEAEGQKNFIW